MDFKPFDYSGIGDCLADAEGLGISLPVSDDLGVLQRRVTIGDRTLPNSLACHPMEGCDGEADGSPGELTVRRYERFARGGSGLIWFEAVAVVPEGKAFTRQLCINKGNIEAFADIRNRITEEYQRVNGTDSEPLIIVQLTHSGRFSRPEGKSAPLIAYHNPILNERMMVDPGLPPVTDDYLESLEGDFVEAALLVREAGFHGVDIKACHRYLNSELLSAHTRDGRYGGDFEGRTRFIRNVTDRIREAIGNDAGRSFILASRLNVYDGIPYPYGWGMATDGSLAMDLSEPLRLVGVLREKGIGLVNVTMGTPYYNPHVNRPYDAGGYVPPEHPLEGVARLLEGTRAVQGAFPDLAVVGTGYSWLRHLSPYLAAGVLQTGGATIIGYGREAFAYPDFARDLREKGAMEKGKCCISCGKCAEILRAGGTTGCVIRDSAVYAPLYRRFTQGQ